MGKIASMAGDPKCGSKCCFTGLMVVSLILGIVFVVLPFAVGSCEKGGECALDTGSTQFGGACEKGNYDESACASCWTATPGLSTATCCAHDYCTFSDDGLSWGLAIFLLIVGIVLAAVVAPIMC